MSFNKSSKEIPPSSNHSLFTPSYSADLLVPIQCQELDLEPSLPITPKMPMKPASLIGEKSFSSSWTPKASPHHPIQYQKLKMNYLRKLNVVPIVSQKDVLATLGTEASLTKSTKASKSSLSSGNKKIEVFLKNQKNLTKKRKRIVVQIKN